MGILLAEPANDPGVQRRTAKETPVLPGADSDGAHVGLVRLGLGRVGSAIDRRPDSVRGAKRYRGVLAEVVGSQQACVGLGVNGMAEKPSEGGVPHGLDRFI